MFEFFKECDQGDLSPVAYKAKLRDSFEHFAKAKVQLPTIVQVMFMCRVLNAKYKPLLAKFTKGTLLLESITDWCKHYDN